MGVRKTAGAFLCLCLLWAAAASAQSLADVARQEAERRKAITSPGKVYTNAALSPEPPSSGATTPGTSAAATVATTPSAPPATAPGSPKPNSLELAAGEPRTTEADWRARVAAARDTLARARLFADALQTRINVLTADYANRDDPAQREAVAADRQRALAELDRVQQEIRQEQKALAAIQDEARRAGVPAGWVR